MADFFHLYIIQKNDRTEKEIRAKKSCFGLLNISSVWKNLSYTGRLVHHFEQLASFNSYPQPPVFSSSIISCTDFISSILFWDPRLSYCICYHEIDTKRSLHRIMDDCIKTRADCFHAALPNKGSVWWFTMQTRGRLPNTFVHSRNNTSVLISWEYL